MTHWKARIRASCPRTRCQDTRYLLANECLHDIRCRAGIEDLDSVGPSPGLDEEALAHALMVGVLAAFEAIVRAVAGGAAAVHAWVRALGVWRAVAVDRGRPGNPGRRSLIARSGHRRWCGLRRVQGGSPR